ncbi:hypothetical protein AB4Y88_18835 [Paenarthrobacter sp. RAF9]
MDSLLADYLAQIVPGVEASWEKAGSNEGQFYNLLVMGRYAGPAISEAISFSKLASNLIETWANGTGRKNPTSELLTLVLEGNDLLEHDDRCRLVDAAVSFIANGLNSSTEDFYA